MLSYFSSMSNLPVTIFPLYVKTVSAMFIPAILIKNLLFFLQNYIFHKCCLMFLILVHILGFYQPSLFLHKNQNIAFHASNLIITRRPDLKWHLLYKLLQNTSRKVAIYHLISLEETKKKMTKQICSYFELV